MVAISPKEAEKKGGSQKSLTPTIFKLKGADPPFWCVISTRRDLSVDLIWCRYVYRLARYFDFSDDQIAPTLFDLLTTATTLLEWLTPSDYPCHLRTRGRFPYIEK
jgi:hypothetical protein